MRVVQRYMPQLGATRCIYMLFYQSDTLTRMFATFSEEKKSFSFVMLIGCVARHDFITDSSFE